MTTSQMLRAERRAERARLEREERNETLAAALVLVLMLVAFLVAGTMDTHDQWVYQQSWYETHGIE